jgi:xylulokinase
VTRLLGLDIGTTAIKALLFDAEQRRVLAVGEAPTPFLPSVRGRSELDPEGIWQATIQAIRAVHGDTSGSGVDAVGIASMGEVGVPLDGAGDPCYPAIAWFDRRSEDQLDWWERTIGIERIYDITGQILHPMYSAPKLQWLRAHEADVWARLDRWLCMEEFIGWQLTGEMVTDYSVASRTLLFDQRRAQWSTELLSATGLPRRLFADAVPSGTIIGQMSAAAARQTGLATGTPVVTGGHDHLVGALPVGAVQPNVLLDSAGTAEGILLTANRYDPSAALLGAGFSTYRHVLPEHFVVVAGQHGAGGLITWLIDRLYQPVGGRRPYDQAFADAARAPVGAGGLFCLPHLRGSRVPEHDLGSRAAFVGIVDGHERGHLLRAALESLGFWLRSSIEVLEAAIGTPVGDLHVVGGATRSPLWLQIKADCTGRTLTIPEVGEAVALGAALLAGVGAGVYADVASAATGIDVPVRHVEPTTMAASQCQRAFAVYQLLFPALRNVNAAIRGLGEGPEALTIL